MACRSGLFLKSEQVFWFKKFEDSSAELKVLFLFLEMCTLISDKDMVLLLADRRGHFSSGDWSVTVHNTNVWWYNSYLWDNLISDQSLAEAFGPSVPSEWKIKWLGRVASFQNGTSLRHKDLRLLWMSWSHVCVSILTNSKDTATNNQY